MNNNSAVDHFPYDIVKAGWTQSFPNLPHTKPDVFS